MSFSSKLTKWYLKNKRDLPWRQTKDPYKIWLSEIILQQTRVEQGLPYYLKFVEKYPDIKKLAKAPEDEVLRLWQGLGYYSRARNLHFTAKEIANKHKGKFPDSYQNIIALKGIGAYTAAAIASFAFDLPHAVLDGNVMRVLSRYLGVEEPIDSAIGKNMLNEAAQDLLDKKNPSIYNQAIMEFGATFCVPAKPDCEKCPFNDSCEAFRIKKVDKLPRKAKKVKISNRYFHYLILENKGKTYIRKRPAGDIWQGLYEFPLVELKEQTAFEKIIKTQPFKELVKQIPVLLTKTSAEHKHVLSHQRIFARFFHLKTEKRLRDKSFKELSFEKLDDYALPRLIHRYLEKIKQ
jgi:A/G-specific adenine glycosylase